MITDCATERHREVWRSALTLPDQPDLQSSLVAELAEYLELPVASVAERCRQATTTLARSWHEHTPTTPEAVTAFYRHTDAYLYDLTWWHTLSADSSALIQAEALQVALDHAARTALDFGSGIGSLGLLLAQHGLSVTLCDINPALNDYARWRFARRGLPVQFLAMAGPHTLPSNGQTGIPADPPAAHSPAPLFDFISAVDVLEHLPDPAAALATLCASLHPGGTLFIHLPSEPDSDHPMHLWHDPTVLLDRLHHLGMWLERSDGPTLVLRRGEGPRYRLNRGLSLLNGDSGGILLSEHPLLAMRLNAQAFGLLSRLECDTTAAALCAGQSGLSLPDITAFLDSLTRRRMLIKTPAPPLQWPSVSVIIPAYGRTEATRACVSSLVALNYPPELLEIIVVDDASDPPLAPTLAGLPVRVLRQEHNIGQSAARNLAAAQARGQFLAFIDNDCCADPDWLHALLTYADDPSIEIIGGRVVAPAPDGPVAAFEAVRSPLDMGPVGGSVGPDSVVAYLPTCNLIVRRDVLLRLQGFDPQMLLGEDVDFIWRTIRAGGQVQYVPEAKVTHYHRTRLRALLRRRADYGSSEADLQRRHPEGRRSMPLPLTVTALLLALVVWSSAWPVGVLLVVLALINVSVELRGKVQRLRRERIQLPPQRILRAVLLAHGAALYHLGANVARYYSLPLLAAGLAWPPLLPALLILVGVPPVTDYFRLKPGLSLPRFVGLYWLELAAYQVGVWRGCLQRRTPGPLLPHIRLSR